MEKKLIKINPFALRQVMVKLNEGKYGGFTGTAEDLEALASKKTSCAKVGNRPYVSSIRLTEGTDYEEGKFLLSYGIHEGCPVRIEKVQRRPGEMPTPEIRFVDKVAKASAKSVDLIMYDSTALKADGETLADPNSDAEVVSVNGHETEDGKDIQNPWSMFRNWFSKNPNDPRGRGGSPYPDDADPYKFIEDLHEAFCWWIDRALP